MRVEVKSGYRVFRTALSLLPGRDDDLIAALEAAPRGHLASTIREMMRSGVKKTFASMPADEEMQIELHGAEFEL